MTAEIQMLARACGKAEVHDLEPEDLRALTLEASMITGVPPLLVPDTLTTGEPGGSARVRARQGNRPYAM